LHVVERVEREVLLPAGADDVWEALTDAELLREWFGGDVNIAVRPGGPARFAGDDGVRHGLVEEVDPGRRLAFRWWRAEESPGQATRVELDLEELDDGTRLTVTESEMRSRARALACV
jgi:uncharacterized protein YndB with AHSA1/START domain